LRADPGKRRKIFAVRFDDQVAALDSKTLLAGGISL